MFDITHHIGCWYLLSSFNSETTSIKIPTSQKFTETSCNELKKQLMPLLWISIRSGFRRLKNLSNNERDRVFPYKFTDLPSPFIWNSSFDILAVGGPSGYDLANFPTRFKYNNYNHSYTDKLYNNNIILGESAYNMVLASEIISSLSYIAGNQNCTIHESRHYLPYTEVSEDILSKHNLFLLPCGDVNPIIPRAFRLFEMQNKVLAPVHHDPIYSSESICDELIRDNDIPLKFEKPPYHQGAGFITLLRNPWNNEKAMLICGGNKGTGTQAALLQVLMVIQGKRKLYDRMSIPGVIVRALINDENLYVEDVEVLDKY
jgi:hypothetical protein